ncbi:hypothetical protein ACFVAD_07795 [Sutcliffiella sp. NPDC057660]|uniref:hypothetical protein n=1 Tax=Sutcliffiella sp. NPDC057660 TaxID=3346199 RepID=UPI00367746DB
MGRFLQSSKEAEHRPLLPMEIIRSLAKYHGSSIEEVDKLRKEKVVKRSGFEEKVFED